MSRMAKQLTPLGLCMILLSGFVTGCDRGPSPIKEGVISELRWNASDGDYVLRRVDRATLGKKFRGDVDMYGVLYPTCLEVRFVRDSGSHVQIIPMNQITWLEFGDGGVAIDNK